MDVPNGNRREDTHPLEKTAEREMERARRGRKREYNADRFYRIIMYVNLNISLSNSILPVYLVSVLRRFIWWQFLRNPATGGKSKYDQPVAFLFFYSLLNDLIFIVSYAIAFLKRIVTVNEFQCLKVYGYFREYRIGMHSSFECT